MKRKFWTAAGILRCEQERDALTERIALYPAMIANARGGQTNTFNDAGAADADGVRKEWKNDVRRLENILTLLEDALPAPVPSKTLWVQLGHLVRVRKEDASEFSFILGGEGEIDQSSEYPTFSCSAPLGQAVLGKEKGQFVEVRTPGGVYEVEIVSISIPTAKQVQEKVPA